MAEDVPIETANEGLSLSRWSRLKRGQNAEKSTLSKNEEKFTVAHNNGAIADVAVIDSGSVLVGDSATPLNAEMQLPSLADVGIEKDFTPFMQAKIPEALKRQALKTLFKDAHFNTMDGLDTYIDDYTKFEPISAAEMDGLSAWKSIMKPLEQVVTPGGYAVDVESDEGKAVLAARAEAALQTEVSGDAPRADASDESLAVDANDEPELHAVLQHERYGKRVSDFKPEPAPLTTATIEPISEAVASPAKSIADDPR